MQALAHDPEAVAFWRRHTVVGVLLCVLLPVVAALHTWATPGAPNAAARYGVCAAVAVLSPLLLRVPVERVVRHRYGRLFFDAWELSGLAGVLTMAVLDGGGASDYLLFLYVLLAHAALAYPPVGMVIAGLVALAGYLGVSTIGAADVPIADLVFGACTLLLTTGICALASHNHVLVHRRTASQARRVAALAELDGLTGCLNNRAFHDRLAATAAEASESHPVSLVILDVDHFKHVNDQHGHPAGDEVLQELGALLRGVCRARDAPGRLGGDEFALLLPDTAAPAARAAAERVRAEIARGQGEHGVTLSVGVATSVHPTDGVGLMAAADRAVYAAKRDGRNRVAEVPV
jgi:diguanylate cyclase (GGDEF)-like protein